MPKQHQLKSGIRESQRGSILVGVMTMSLVMTLAAGGFLLLVGNVAKDNKSASEEMSLHYAAESGILMGVRWVRCHTPAYFTSGWVGPPMTLTTGSDGFSVIDGYKVNVSITGGAPGLRTLKCLATRGNSYDTLQISWRVDTVVTDASTPCKPVLSNWSETLYPGHS